MPNWVTNRVKFNKRGEEILKKIIVKKEKVELGEVDIYFDFNKVIPMPKELDIIDGSIKNIAIQYALSKKTKEEKESIIENLIKNHYINSAKYSKAEMEKENENFISHIANNTHPECNFSKLNINNLEDLGNAYINNIRKYGYSTWYEWRIANWGTKWNSHSVYIINNNEIEFDTAWSCPVPILVELSNQFKDVEIEVEYADEDIGHNCGTITIKNGEIEDMMELDGDVEFALEVKGYSEEDIKEYMEEYED